MPRGNGHAPRLGDPSLYSLVVEKLATSGLTAEHGQSLGVAGLSAATVAQLEFVEAPAMKIPYWDPWTGEALAGWPKAPPFYRLRYLQHVVDVKQLLKSGKPKPLRYVQPTGSAPCAYYPRIPDCDWPAILGGTMDLLITEGELKAAKAVAERYPCIGLGGVWNWRAHEQGIVFLRDLEQVNWVGRRVYVVFDSDCWTNPDILRALAAFGDQLVQRGARPYTIVLPQEGDAKVGLDDFLIAHGTLGLENLMDSAEPYTLANALWDLNARVAYVQDPGLVVELGTGLKMAPGAFKDHAYAAETYLERTLTIGGKTRLEPVSAAGAWLRWPLRGAVRQITYAPGHGQYIDRADGTKDYNGWRGWGVQPAKGDVKPFLKLVKHLFTESEEGAMEWFLSWLAYPLQNPGVKMYSAVVMHGRHRGTGKSMIGELMGRIYGENYIMIEQSHLHGNFNSWAYNKQFIMGDEISGSDKRADADLLKNMITRETMQVNIKNVPEFVVPDVINYYWVSNHPDAFFMDDKERRYFVNDVRVPPLDLDFYMKFREYKAGDAGPAAVFQYLLDYSCRGFDPHGKAFLTRAKGRMVRATQSDAQTWIAHVLEDPETMLRVGNTILKHDLYTSREALALYDPAGRTKLTPQGMSRELVRAGIYHVNGGDPVRVGDRTDRYFPLRTPETWYKATVKHIQEHLEGHKLEMPKGTVRTTTRKRF
jgi:hypothetical protein